MMSSSADRLPSFDAQSQMNYEPLVNWSRQDQQVCGFYEMESEWLLHSLAIYIDHHAFYAKYGEIKCVNLFG